MSDPTPVQSPPDAQTQRKKKPPRSLPPYHVILLDDDDHTHEYVVDMLLALFGHEPEFGLILAKEVNESGRAIVFTTHRELAELKCEQIHAFGGDHRVATCKGSMSAVVEPAEE